jgi:hypothetical protein
MNERIRELILEAGFPKFDKMYVVSDGEELKKFAKLIIEECVDYAFANGDDVDYLKQYFGVEE